MASIRRVGNSWRAETYRLGRRKSKNFSSRALAEDWAARDERRVSGMPVLEGTLQDHRLTSVLPKRLTEALSNTRYTESEIADAAFPCESTTGVYFLVKDLEVVYVGQTTNFLYRLYRHQQSGRTFDSFAFIPCREEDLDGLESAYIAALQPRQNRMF